MEHPDLHELLRQQQIAISELRDKVDMLVGYALTLQSFLLLHATDPERLQQMGYEKALKVATATFGKAFDMNELTDALRRQQPPSDIPPHAAN